MSKPGNISTKGEEQKAIQKIRDIRGTGNSAFLDFIHFLLDFNIIGYTAAFIIAVSASELFNSIGKAIVKTMLKALHLSDVMSEIVKDIIAFVIIIILVFSLMYFVIQPIVASRQVQVERKVKELVKTAEEKKIQETAEIVKEQQKNGKSFSNFAMF